MKTGAGQHKYIYIYMPYVANEILSRAPILLQLSETFQEFSILMTFLLF